MGDVVCRLCWAERVDQSGWLLDMLRFLLYITVEAYWPRQVISLFEGTFVGCIALGGSCFEHVRWSIS